MSQRLALPLHACCLCTLRPGPPTTALPACLPPSRRAPQLVLATYMLLFLLAVESIVVHHIVERHAKKQDAQVRATPAFYLLSLGDDGGGV